LWKKLIATLPSSTKLLNKKLDQQITSREPVDYRAPWYERGFTATALSTIKSLLGIRKQ